MKSVDADKMSLADCVTEAQQERLIIMRDGKPVALVIGVQGLDEEQLRLGSNDRFWELIRGRRGEATISRTELEQKVRSEKSARTRRATPTD